MYYSFRFLVIFSVSSARESITYFLKNNNINNNVLWCNGSTTVFGAVCRGSNPLRTTSGLIPILGYVRIVIATISIACESSTYFKIFLIHNNYGCVFHDNSVMHSGAV